MYFSLCVRNITTYWGHLGDMTFFDLEHHSFWLPYEFWLMQYALFIDTAFQFRLLCHWQKRIAK